MGKSVKKTGSKSVVRRGQFAPGDDPRRGRGPAKGAPNAGRPPDEFKAMMANMSSREETVASLGAILNDPTHPQWVKAWKFCVERGYGKEAQNVELTGKDGGPVDVRQVIVVGGVKIEF